MVRVCPKRDAQCPHGENCSFVIDRYNCAPEPSPPVTNPMELARKLRDLSAFFTDESFEGKTSRSAAGLIEAHAVLLAERDAEIVDVRNEARADAYHRKVAEALLQQALEGVGMLIRQYQRDIDSEEDMKTRGDLTKYGHDILCIHRRFVAQLRAIQPGDSHER